MKPWMAVVAIAAAAAFTVYNSPHVIRSITRGVTRRRNPLTEQEARHG